MNDKLSFLNLQSIFSTVHPHIDSICMATRTLVHQIYVREQCKCLLETDSLQHVCEVLNCSLSNSSESWVDSPGYY